MEKSAAEKALEGSLLSKLGDPRYFIMFSAFGLYWDFYLYLTSGAGLLHLTYRIGDAFPIGNMFILIGGFSLLASFLSPAIFWICNHLFWDLWILMPERIRPGQTSSVWLRWYSKSVSTHQLKLWAIKRNSALAMSLVKEQESAEDEIQKNRPHPFLLVICICINYVFAPNGVLRVAERALSPEFEYYFLAGLLAFSVLLLYVAFNAIPDTAGNFYLPGLKEYIGEDEKG